MSAPRVALLQANTPDLVENARKLFVEYAQSIATDLEYQGFAAELAALPGPYAPPSGGLLIAYAGHEAAGCAAFRALDRGVAEMKRLYVRPNHRGAGLGRRLVAAIMEAARAGGYVELRLDTLPRMASAQALYRTLGFIEIPPYNDNHLPGTRFYSLQLEP
jgi:putative acetyltransferase